MGVAILVAVIMKVEMIKVVQIVIVLALLSNGDTLKKIEKTNYIKYCFCVFFPIIFDGFPVVMMYVN
jgi:hypothetical protein